MNARRALASIVLALGLVVALGGGGVSAGPRTFRAHLTGDQVAPLPVETRAQGQAILKLSEDGESLHYKLIVANIEDVRGAGIHLGPADEKGRLVAWLHPETLIPGRYNGVLAEGVLTRHDLRSALQGRPLSALVDVMSRGYGHVVVYTTGHTAFGEIRGQIR